MKQKWSKRLTAIAAAILILMVGILPVSAAESVTDAKEMDATYFQKLESADGTLLTGTPSLTIRKYETQADGTADTNKPINGVEFKYAKVGGLYQLTLANNTTVMAYGVTEAFAQAVGITGSANYTDADGDYYFYKNGAVIQNATRGKTVTDLNTFLVENAAANNVQTGTTENGIIRATQPAYGLYIVAEYDVTNAKDAAGKPISITQRQNPFIVSLPYQNGDYWTEDVVANVKNSTGVAEVEKKIVVDANETRHDGDEAVADTDITSIGDTVHFRLKGTILPIPNKSTTTSTETIEKYILTDYISKGLTPVKENGLVRIDAVRVVGHNTIVTLNSSDYTVSAPKMLTGTEDDYTEDFAGGQQFTITFTPAGLDKLTEIAKSTETTKAVYFYYSATVNKNAVIGPKADGASNNSGNPNRVKLDYKVSNNSEMETTWDTVTEFTFGLNVTKQFEGTPPANAASAVTFKLYSSTDNGATKTYYKFEGTDGAYTKPTAVAADASAATALKLGANKQISIKGLEEGTYYVEEIATAAGYNLLKEPVKIQITAETGSNAFVNPNGSDYLGTTNTSGTGAESVTIINTQGFQLPATGGAGIWMFVLGGILVIGMGCVYFVASKRKKN